MKDYYPGNLGGNDRRYVRPVRQYDTNQNDRRTGVYRRNGLHQRKRTPEVSAEVLNEGLQVIKDCLQKTSQSQQRMAEVQGRIARAQERKADAMEQIAVYLKRLVGDDTVETIEHETIAELSQPTQPIDAAGDQEPSPEVLPEVLEDPAVSEAPSGDLEAPVVQETPSVDVAAKDALQVITEMRKNGVTYDKIAEHLNLEEIENICGNSSWNRRTVSRVYKESVS